MRDSIRRYFALESAVLGGNKGVSTQAALYSGVAAGSVGQWLFTGLQSGDFPMVTLGAGLIASVVTFPTIFQSAGLNKVTKVNFVKWCVAFQNGFFWPAVMSQVGKAFAPT